MIWGCDAPAPGPVWSSTCPECLRADLDCSRCLGRGEVEYDRCPASMVDPQARAAAQGAAWASYGIAPCDGGWGQQVALGASLIDLANFEKARIREAQQASGTESAP